MSRPKTRIGRTIDLLANMEPGDTLFIDRPLNSVASYVSASDIKVKTESVLCIEKYGSEPVVQKITKITLL